MGSYIPSDDIVALNCQLFGARTRSLVADRLSLEVLIPGAPPSQYLDTDPYTTDQNSLLLESQRAS